MQFTYRGSEVYKIRMRKLADMHQHLRQGAILQLVAPMVAKRFAMAIVMPNTTPPITTGAQVTEYNVQILEASGGKFFPLMTMYLTDSLEPEEVRKELECKGIVGIKYYPRGLTTNSDSGVKDPSSLWTSGTNPYEVLRVLAEHGAVLLLHAADGFDRDGNELDPYDQEKHFIRETLPRIIDAHPNLKISVEHLSTGQGAKFMRQCGGEKLGCSLTAQHLLLDRRDVFRGGFRPHKFWWPIIQPKEHRDELRRFASEGHPFVWLGSDSAPHPVGKKETDCCSGGVLMAHGGIEFYVEAFEDMECLNKLEDFASVNGPRFYGLQPSEEYIELKREEWVVKKPFYAAAKQSDGIDIDKVVPFRLGEKVRWKLVE